MAASTSASTYALVLKVAGVFGESTGKELFSVKTLDMQNRTSIDATFTLTEAVNGFFLFAKLLKKNVHIQIFVDGEVTDSDFLDITPVATLQGSAAAPTEGWFAVNLAAGAHPYKLDVAGAAESSAYAIEVKTAASEGDTGGEQLLAFTGSQCNGGRVVMDTLTLSAAIPYLYVRFAPETRSTFSASLVIT